MPKIGAYTLEFPKDAEAIVQGEVERLMREYRRKAEKDESDPEMAGRTVRAALAAGWVSVEPVVKAEDVASLRPGVVAEMARQINAYYARALVVPKA